MRPHNLLTERLIRFETTEGIEAGSLPEVYAALMADRVESFPALRAHQQPAWHMFLAQLGALACHRAGLDVPPGDPASWQDIIGRLTRDKFPADEPWCLVVEDFSKPAFLQPPVPEGTKLKETEPVTTPDALDMLITSRNHDLKQSVARNAGPDDWLFALVSLQTMEGYGGGGGRLNGIVRMNGGSSSRVLMGLAPLVNGKADVARRPGPWLKRDITQLLVRRDKLLDETPIPYRRSAGLALTWTAPWLDGDQLTLNQLDIWFIEVCRRVRLRAITRQIFAITGNSSAPRTDDQDLKGVLGDPWAPAHRTEGKALTISAAGRFDYERVIDLLLSGDWHLPALVILDDAETHGATNWHVVLSAIARGNSKTGGFQSRAIPLRGRVAGRLGPKRLELHQCALLQVLEIEKVDLALRNALALAAAGGLREKIKKDTYARTNPYRERLDTVADRMFFPALWARFEAEQEGKPDDVTAARRAFLLPLIDAARDLLDEGLADIPCPSIHRPRAEARARRRFETQLRSDKYGFPGLFDTDDDASDTDEDITDAA